MDINWIFYPKTTAIPTIISQVIDIFIHNSKIIDSSKNDTNELRLPSDKVLEIVSDDLLNLGYLVETGKKKEQKIRVPVLFGKNGTIDLAFEVDGYHKEHKIVIEIEAGRAYTNHQFLKDIFETSMMVDVDFLVLAVRNLYKGRNDYEKISHWLETLYLTNRIKLDLKGVLLVGY